MKQSRLILLPFLCVALSFCKNATTSSAAEQSTAGSEQQTSERYNVNPAEITKDWKAWYNYTYYQIRLAQDFIGYDVDSSVMQKADFLKKLSGGKCIALKVGKEKERPVYQLFQLKEPKPDIITVTVQMANDALRLMKMEGKPIPPFRFTDINEKAYDTEQMKGKVSLIKCWFINCVACVAEFPELNKLVDQYKDRNSIQFISLASDSKKDLVAFLAKRKFKYAVIPAADDYMTNKLAVAAYPTHILVDKNGIIKKVTNSIEDLIPSLEKEIQNTGN
jgi:thiol-disulfide isomerase/thioredoxin